MMVKNTLQLCLLWEPLSSLVDRLGAFASTALLLVISWSLSVIFWPTERPNAPVAGYRSMFEPSFLLKARFIRNANKIIGDAYKTMRDRPFVVRRYDLDFVVLPVKYLEEIRLISYKKLSSRGAQVGNLVPDWNGLDGVVNSNLHVEAVRRHLNPDLYKYVDYGYNELAHGWADEVPRTDDWSLTNIEEVMRRLMARITAKIFMGDTASRDPSWINISVGFSVDLFESSFGIKMFPPWTYPFIVWLIPARYRVRRQLAATRQMVDKLLQRLNDAQARRRQGETIDEEDTLLNWMVENGKPWENTVPQMAARLCVLAMASIHTTAATLANVVYELCAHPEWIPVLQEEIDTIAQDLGKPDDNLASEGSTSKQWCERLEKLDSFIMESQRHNPVMILNPQRLATEPIMLSGGVYIPAGTRLAFANHEHHMDPRTHPDPAVFDPLRSYRKRHAAADQRHLHLADQTHPSALSFGYGNQACAGRHFAVAVMKLIMARMLYEFDFRFPEGQGMPENRYVDENVYKDLGARVEMRRRARG